MSDFAQRWLSTILVVPMDRLAKPEIYRTEQWYDRCLLPPQTDGKKARVEAALLAASGRNTAERGQGFVVSRTRERQSRAPMQTSARMVSCRQYS